MGKRPSRSGAVFICKVFQAMTENKNDLAVLLIIFGVAVAFFFGWDWGQRRAEITLLRLQLLQQQQQSATKDAQILDLMKDRR